MNTYSALLLSLIVGMITSTACNEPVPSSSAASTEEIESDVSNMEMTRSGDTFELVWASESEAPVSVYMSDMPNMDVSEMQLLAEGVSGSQFEATVADSMGRPYFSIISENGGRRDVAERLLPLEGGRNFRDLGGYPAADGKHTRWGKMYRSGVLANLTDADYDYLSDLDIAVVCDFRASEERTEETTNWRGASAPQIVSWGYASVSDEDGGMAEMFKDGVTEEAMKKVMMGMYASIAYDHAEKYAFMFKQLANGETPLLFHCSAGKDRAGTGAALLLTALGVPRDVVVHDYSLSETFVDYEAEFEDAFEEARTDERSTWNFLATLSPEVRRPLFRSDPDYIRATFATLEENHGSVENFIRDVMEIDDATIQAMRDRLLY